jgi:hypothetical protein
LEKDVSISNLLRKRVAAPKQIQQTEQREDKQLFHDDSLGNNRKKMGRKENGSIT